MLITCPGCASKYEVPEQLLAAGPRRLRCTGCGLDFDTPAPPMAKPPPLSAPPPLIAPPPLPERPMPPPLSAQFSQPRLVVPFDDGPTSRHRGAGVALVMAWAISFAALGTAGWAALHYREALMAAWPPSQRVYAAIGLTPAAP